MAASGAQYDQKEIAQTANDLFEQGLALANGAQKEEKFRLADDYFKELAKLRELTIDELQMQVRCNQYTGDYYGGRYGAACIRVILSAVRDYGCKSPEEQIVIEQLCSELSKQEKRLYGDEKAVAPAKAQDQKQAQQPQPAQAANAGVAPQVPNAGVAHQGVFAVQVNGAGKTAIAKTAPKNRR